MSPWACPIRVYITVANEEFPVCANLPGWAAVGEYLSGPEFPGIAGRVVSVVVVNRIAGYGGAVQQ